MLVAVGLSALTTWYFTQPEENSKTNDAEVKRLSNECNRLNKLLEGMTKGYLEKKYADLLKDHDDLQTKYDKLKNGGKSKDESFIATCIREHPGWSAAFGLLSASVLVWVGHYFWPSPPDLSTIPGLSEVQGKLDRCDK